MVWVKTWFQEPRRRTSASILQNVKKAADTRLIIVSKETSKRFSFFFNFQSSVLQQTTANLSQENILFKTDKRD